MKSTAPWSVEEWKHWGAEDPMYGVATQPGRRKGEATAWTPEDFYALGEAEARVFLDMWQQWMQAAPGGVLLEIGCGAGRLTRAFANSAFARVIGVDVSEGMLATASPHMPANVELRLGNGETLPAESASADAGFTYIVLQHFDNLAMVEACVRDLARVIRPGGTVMLHLPAVEPRQRLRQLLGGYTLRRALTKLRRRMLPGRTPRGRFWVTMNYMMVPVDAARAMLARCGFVDVATQVMPGNDQRGMFYFARRAAA